MQDEFTESLNLDMYRLDLEAGRKGQEMIREQVEVEVDKDGKFVYSEWVQDVD